MATGSKRHYNRDRLSGPGWEELGQSSSDDRKSRRHDLSNAALLAVIPRPLLTKYCNMIRDNTVLEDAARSPYRAEPRKGCIILLKKRAQSKLHFVADGREHNFFVDDKHLLYYEATGVAVDYPSVEISHDCHRDGEFECVNIEHFILEGNSSNNSRNGCSCAAFCDNCCLVTYSGTRCHENKHQSAGKRLCRGSIDIYKPMPRSAIEKRARLEQLQETRRQIDTQIAAIEKEVNV